VIDDADDQPEKPKEALNDCEQKVEELEEENAQLRNAAETFGDLAERLNAERRAAKGLPPKPKALKDEKSQTRKGLPS
jgi:predicted RNase H-like nuclease (RuvC/YqgF family)